MGERLRMVIMLSVMTLAIGGFMASAEADARGDHWDATGGQVYSTAGHGRSHGGGDRHNNPSYSHVVHVPRARAVTYPAGAAVRHNGLLHHEHHSNWHPRYNFYNHGYHFYPYINMATVVDLTPDNVPVMVDGTTYYYGQGAFYQQDAQGYSAVPPPIGAIVAALPAGATQMVINGEVYYFYNGVYYKPVPQGFEVVEPLK